MLGISLIFVGITLIINGILLLKNKNIKLLVVINFFTGFLVLLFNFYSILTDVNKLALIGYFGGLLFGLTNLLIAFDNVFKEGTIATGVYSGFATLSAVVLGSYYIATAQILQGVAWLVWSFIWLFSFIAFLIDKRFKKGAYIMFIVQGFTTTFVFGFLQLLDIVKF